MATTRERIEPEAGNIVDMSWDPITRIVGNLGIYTKIDFKQREVVSCKSTSSIFRGYSVFMKGKDPRDAHFITSRICGICGDNHAVCSQYAQNMAYGVKTPPLGEWIVNLGEAAEYMFDHTIFQDNLVFVDFCEQMIRDTNPGVMDKADKTEAPHADIHGYRTIGDIMRAYNPFTGEVYRESLHMSRITREMICLMEGRHVHPSTIYPGGVGTQATPQLFTDYLSRLLRCMDFFKKAVPMNDDVFDFIYEAMPGYEEVGRRRILLGCWGAFNNPEHVDYDYRNMERLGQRDVRHPGRRRRRRAGDDEPRRHQPRHPHPARLVLLRGLGERADLRRQGPAGQPGRQAPPVEPDHDPEAAEARPRGRQLLVGDEPALVRQAHGRLPRARHGRRRDRAPVGDGAGRQGPDAVRAVHGPRA